VSDNSTKYLGGSLQHASSAGWYYDFSKARGASWSDPSLIVQEPVIALTAFSALALPLETLSQAVKAINQKRLLYKYEKGPNSNTFVRLLLQKIGHPLPQPPGLMVLKGWLWDG
jgi:hypothetical protein